MKLDSVRELKSSLTDQVLAGLSESVRVRSVLGGAARPLTPGGAAPPTLALGVAPREAGQFALAVRVQQRALEQGREVELIRRAAKGEVDVRYIGEVRKRAVPWYQSRLRPLRIGGSVGHFKVTAGTLGGFVHPRGGGPLALLSNNHVLANENRGKRGDAVLQPGSFDGGANPGDAVAQLAAFVRLKRIGKNFVDCATAVLDEGVPANETKLTGLGKLRGVGDVFVDEGTRVAKLGRTTGLTRGRVTAFELDNVTVGFDIGALRFDNQIEIESSGTGPFSAGGDSGSLIVGADRRAVALLFAGSDQGGANGQGLTYANPIHAVLDALQMELAV